MRPTRALIDLPALRHNYGVAAALGDGGQTMPIVKANAYGHGAVEVARALEPLAPALGVASIDEALELRAAGITKPILLLEGFFDAAELDSAARMDFWLLLHSEWQLQALERARLPAPVRCWLKLDTGMHRLGFPPQRAREYVQRLQGCKQATGTPVLATHFASADALDSAATRDQVRCFEAACRGMAAPRSLANSPGLLGWPESRADWNRPGIMLYGLSPFPAPHPEADKLRPVMTFRSEIIALRDVPPGEGVGYAGTWSPTRPARVATVPVGYGDGYPRHAENSTPALINGQRVRLVGRVSMDLITLDVTGVDGVAPGQEVVLWGRDLAANEVAAHADTIGYEIVTRLHNRVPRVVVDG